MDMKSNEIDFLLNVLPGKVGLAMLVNIHPTSKTSSLIAPMGKEGIGMLSCPVKRRSDIVITRKRFPHNSQVHHSTCKSNKLTPKENRSVQIQLVYQ